MIDFEYNPPPAPLALSEVEERLGRRLPQSYRAFMSKHDGGEGDWGAAYLILWKIGELLPYNQDYEVSTYAPGLLMFGSNGGGEAFAFDLREPAMPIKVVPFIGMSHKTALPLADDFDAFLTTLEIDGIF